MNILNNKKLYIKICLVLILLVTIPLGTIKIYNNNQREEKFINRVKDIAIFNMNKSSDKRLFASVSIAQAIIESNFGDSKLARETKNLYGLKATDKWNGNKYSDLLYEEINGQIIEKDVAWRIYNDENESMNDYYNYLIENIDRTSSEIFLAETNVEQIEAISKEYTFSKEYVDLITRVIEQYNLDKYDRVKSELVIKK